MKRLLDNMTGKIGIPETLFSYKRENNVLVFEFIAKESSLTSYSNIHNDKLYDDNVVEVFLDLGDEFYYEFEVAPNGATFIATIINRKITFFDDNFFSATSTIQDDSYHVIMKMDLSKLGNSKPIKFNAFRIERKHGCVLQALSPTLCDTFHIRNKFIELK